ncbi:MAG TPA: hypothetical protein VNV62_18605 [Trebonia sp.]|nr:hypothetical protein [Trebonia sp.]
MLPPPPRLAEDWAARVARSAARELATPAKRAYWGTYVAVLAILRSRRVAPLPAFLAALLAAEGARKMWQAMEDVHALAEEVRQPPGAPDDGMCKNPDCPNLGGVWRDCPQFREAGSAAGGD